MVGVFGGPRLARIHEDVAGSRSRTPERCRGLRPVGSVATWTTDCTAPRPCGGDRVRACSGPGEGPAGRRRPSRIGAPRAGPRADRFKGARATGLFDRRYEPSLSVVLRGRKRSIVGDDVQVWGRERFIITPVDLPVVAGSWTQRGWTGSSRSSGGWTGGGRGEVVASMSVPVSPSGIAATRCRDWGAGRRPWRTPSPGCSRCSMRQRTSPCCSRSCRGEIVLRLLQTEQAPRITALDGTGPSVVAGATALLTGRMAEVWSMERLARELRVSESTLFARFKEATGMTPAQYLKRTRLGEARRRMVVHGDTAARAAAAGGVPECVALLAGLPGGVREAAGGGCGGGAGTVGDGDGDVDDRDLGVFRCGIGTRDDEVMTLHEAMIEVLREKPSTDDQPGDRRRHQRSRAVPTKDGRPLPAGQVSARARNYDRLFVRTSSRITVGEAQSGSGPHSVSRRSLSPPCRRSLLAQLPRRADALLQRCPPAPAPCPELARHFDPVRTAFDDAVPGTFAASPSDARHRFDSSSARDLRRPSRRETPRLGPATALVERTTERESSGVHHHRDVADPSRRIDPQQSVSVRWVIASRRARRASRSDSRWWSRSSGAVRCT